MAAQAMLEFPPILARVIGRHWQQGVLCACSSSIWSSHPTGSQLGWPTSQSAMHHALRASSTDAQHASSSPTDQGALQPKPDYERIRARIFGEPIRPDERTGRRQLARPLQGAKLASWYFMPPRMPGSHNEEHEYVSLRKLNKREKKKADADTGKKKK